MLIKTMSVAAFSFNYFCDMESAIIGLSRLFDSLFVTRFFCLRNALCLGFDDKIVEKLNYVYSVKNALKETSYVMAAMNLANQARTLLCYASLSFFYIKTKAEYDSLSSCGLFCF